MLSNMTRHSPTKSCIAITVSDPILYDRFYRVKKLMNKKLRAKLSNEDFLYHMLDIVEKELLPKVESY